MFKKGLLLLFIVLLLGGCLKDSFSVSSVRMRRSSEVEVGPSGTDFFDRETLLIEPLFSGSDSLYSFVVTDPTGLLRWEGTISSLPGSSESLLITPGASYPDGEYSITFTSRDDGSEVSYKAVLPELDRSFPSFVPSYGLKTDYRVDVVEYDENGEKIRENMGVTDGFIPSGRTRKAEIAYTDRYSNKIEVTQELSAL